MDERKKHDKFFIARFKHSKKRKPFLKAYSTIKYEIFRRRLDESFFARPSDEGNQIQNYKENKDLEIAKLEKARDAVNKQKSKRRYISFIFLIINLCAISVIMYRQARAEGFSSFADLIASGANFNYIYLALLGFPLLTLLEWGRYYFLLRDAVGRSRHFLAYKIAALGKYYDFITPLGTGGQPFQVYYLNKRQVKAKIATSVPLAKYIFSQFVHVLFAIIVLVSNIGVANNVVIVSAAWVGVTLQGLIIGTVLLLSVSKKIGPSLTIGVLKLLSKMHIIKNYEVTFLKVMRFVREYQKSMKYFITNIPLVGISLLLGVFYTLAQGTIPFLIYSAFSGFDPSMWWPIVSKLVMLEFAVSFVPLPGGAGAAELSFEAMFASLFIGGSFFWAILIWRFIVYYAFIMQGFVILIYNMIIGDKKADKLKKIGFWTYLPRRIKLNRKSSNKKQ